MIKTIADLLRELMVKEAAELDEEPVKHGPTIGAMYEGLARDIFDRAIPAELDVRVVDGFIEGVDGILSPQIDAMIVTGEGRPIPYTSNFVWPIADVIAVFEVKKTLYADDLADAFGKLRTIKHMSEAHVQNGVLAWIDDHTVRMIDAGTVFTGFMPSGAGFSTTDADRLSPWLTRELDKRKR